MLVNLLPIFTGMLILQVYTCGAIKIRTMSLAIAINLNENLKTRGPTKNSIATQIPGLRTSQTNHSRNNKLAF